MICLWTTIWSWNYAKIYVESWDLFSRIQRVELLLRSSCFCYMIWIPSTNCSQFSWKVQSILRGGQLDFLTLKIVHTIREQSILSMWQLEFLALTHVTIFYLYFILHISNSVTNLTHISNQWLVSGILNAWPLHYRHL